MIKSTHANISMVMGGAVFGIFGPIIAIPAYVLLGLSSWFYCGRDPSYLNSIVLSFVLSFFIGGSMYYFNEARLGFAFLPQLVFLSDFSKTT